MTSMRRNDVASTSFRPHVANRFLINQCQIILKYDIMENSRIELRGIVLPVQVDALLGGPKGMLAPPLSNYWGGLAPLAPPLPTPMRVNPYQISQLNLINDNASLTFFSLVCHSTQTTKNVQKPCSFLSSG